MSYLLDTAKVRALALEANIASLGALCDLAQIHRNSLTPYVKGERSPFTQVVLDIAKALGVPATDIIRQQDDENLLEAKDKFRSVLPAEHALFLFGSRARGDAQKYSDIDLGITGGKSPLGFSEFSRLKTKAEELFDSYPLSINLVNLDIAPDDFLFSISRDLQFFLGDEKTASFFMGYLYGRKKNQAD